MKKGITKALAYVHQEGWPCACVKRNRQGFLSHIKINHVSVTRCRKCGATQAAILEMISNEEVQP